MTNAPFIKGESSVSSMMRDMLFAMTVLLILPVIHYGARPAVMALLTACVCAVCEILFNLIQTRTTGISDASSIVTGMIITMLMPVNAPLWLPCAAGVFAILVAKGPFGSTGRNPFNPAAAGFSFAVICWPQLVFTYANPALTDILPIWGNAGAPVTESPAAVLKNGLMPNIMPLDMLWGNFAGPVGTTSILVIAACGLFLYLKRTARWEITFFFLAAAVVIAAFFPRIACSPLTSVKYELMSGSVLFCSVFLVTDPVTSPHSVRGRCVYGLLAGVLVMLFRYYGAFEQGATFAVLIANALAPIIDGLFVSTEKWEEEPDES